MAVNYYEEKRKMIAEQNRRYKEMMIKDILEWQTRGQHTREELEKKSIRTLERIYDYVD